MHKAFSRKMNLNEVDSVHAEDFLDDGTPIRFRIDIDRRDGTDGSAVLISKEQVQKFSYLPDSHAAQVKPLSLLVKPGEQSPCKSLTVNLKKKKLPDKSNLLHLY